MKQTSNNNELVQTNEFYIYSFQPYQRIKHIKIRPFYFISVLNVIFPSDSMLIYKGQVLDRKKTFENYQIKNEDKIVVLPFHLTKSSPELIEKWKNETLDTENFDNKIKVQINPNSRKEIARIRDFRIFKSESKKTFKSNNFLVKFYENKKNNYSPLSLDYPQVTSPICDPLPVIL